MPNKSKKTKRTKKTAAKRSLLNRLANLRLALAFGVVLVIFGLALFGLQMFNIWRSQQTSAASQPIGEVLNGPSVDDDQAYISGIPVHVTVPTVNIDLEVIRGYYYPKSNSWTLTLDKAQWGEMTRPANDKSGVTFIYAHYRKGVFLNLPKIKPGEIAQIKTDKGHTFTYRFRTSSVVPPQDTALFNYQGKPILILQTCTGVRFENRQLFVFDLVKVE